MPRAKHQTPRRHLTKLYNQLQAVMPLLQEIVQPEEVCEASQPYAAPLRYHVEKRGRESWAVLDREELVVLAKYKKGAAAVVERLEDYERRIADLTRPAPQHASAGDSPAMPSLNRTTQHWYTRIAAAPLWPSLSENQSVPISCGLI